MGWLRLLGVVLALVCTGLVLLAFATRERRYLNHAILARQDWLGGLSADGGLFRRGALA
ncbi:hypothetical protein ABWL39_05705 [Chitinivorax sp. PXF-14]|uniref:hypothetical protein n=1 Tax=Chitinivorax sp. PXF-14 TaxID=3230488 RepID=UPI00346557F8